MLGGQMYILLEYITCVVLVAGAMTALFAACAGCVLLGSGIINMIKALYRIGLSADHRLPRPSAAALSLRSLVPVKISIAENRPRLVSRNRSEPW
jgi:uncharacterized membrane protein YphA (DoxX/SURF4 family)